MPTLNRLASTGRRRLVSSLLLLSFSLTTLLPTPAAHAQGGIALAGTFHLQEYTLPQGTEIGNPSIYLVVFNHGDDLMAVEMQTDAPFGVEVLLEETEFTLEAGGQRQLSVTVRVTENAAPGEYDLVITAYSGPVGEVGGTGARLAAASAQKASLVVTGDASTVKASVVTPDGLPMEAQVRLFKVVGDRLNEIILSETGLLDVTLAPGLYRVIVYIAGRQLAQEEFEVLAGEVKEIQLTVRTAYAEQFGIEPNYIEDTGLLSFVRMVYTINNLSGPLENVEVILRVYLDGELVEEITLMTVGRLEMGRTGGSASYVPADGWQEGNYTFKIDLNVEGDFYIESSVQELTVAPEDVGAPAAALPRIISNPFALAVPAPGGVSIIWWVLILVLVITVSVVLWIRRRRRLAIEKPEAEAPLPAEEEEAEVPVEEAEDVVEPEAPPPAEEEGVEALEEPARAVEEGALVEQAEIVEKEPAEALGEAARAAGAAARAREEAARAAEEATRAAEEAARAAAEAARLAEEATRAAEDAARAAEEKVPEAPEEEAEEVPEGEIEEPPEGEIEESPPSEEDDERDRPPDQ